MQSSIVMRPTERPLTPRSPTREGAFQSPPPPGRRAARPACLLPPPPTSDLDQVPLSITVVDNPELLRLELKRQVYGEEEPDEEREDPSPSEYGFMPPLRADASGQLQLRCWAWEDTISDKPLAMVARRRDDDSTSPRAVVGLVTIAVRRLQLRGQLKWVGIIGPPIVDTLELPVDARDTVRRRLIEAVELHLRRDDDPVGSKLDWMLHRPRAGNPDGIKTAEELVADRVEATGKPIPDGELRLGWERLHTPQLRMEVPVPLSAEIDATTLLRQLQPAHATLAQADCMLPKALEVRPLPLALPAGGAGWATRWGCGLDRAGPSWQEVWRRARIARVAYSTECNLDGTVSRDDTAVLGGWPPAAAAAGVFGRLDKARIDGWAAVVPRDRTPYASVTVRKPPPNPNADAIPPALDCRQEDDEGRGGGWPAFPRVGSVVVHLPSGEVGEVLRVHHPSPPEGSADSTLKDQSAVEALLEKRKVMRKGKEVVNGDKSGESMADFADALYIDHDNKEEDATGVFRVAPGGQHMVELLFADGGLSAPCSFNSIRPATTKSRSIYYEDKARGLEVTAAQDRKKTPARLLWEPQERFSPGALGMLEGRVGVVTKGKRFDAAGKPTQVRLRWQDGSHSRWHLIQEVQLPPEPLSSIAQAMAAVEENKRVAMQAEETLLHAAAMEEKSQWTRTSEPIKYDGGQVGGDAAAEFFETGVEADDPDDCNGDEADAANNATPGGGGGSGEGDGLLGVDISQVDGEQTTDNSVWEPDRVLAYGLFLVRDIPSDQLSQPESRRRAVQMIEFGHAPLAQSSQPDGTLGEEGSVDTGGSDWSQQSRFDPSDEREPLAQLLLAHAIDSAAAQITQHHEGVSSSGSDAQPGDSVVVGSGPAAVFPRLCASAAAVAKRAATVSGTSKDRAGECENTVGVGLSITTEDSTVGAMEDNIVADEEEPLALPTELLWQPAANIERKVKVRTEKHVIWPADLVF